MKKVEKTIKNLKKVAFAVQNPYHANIEKMNANREHPICPKRKKIAQGGDYSEYLLTFCPVIDEFQLL